MVRRFAFSTGLVMLVMTGAAPIACAELVVFTHGRVIKALSHQVTGDRIQIHLPGGGSYTLDRSLVEGIEEDEVAGAIEQRPVQAPSVEPPGRVETSRTTMNEQVVPPTDPKGSSVAPKASEEKPPVPVPRRTRRHRR